MPKISIIVPVYNVEKYIHQCLDSILNQSYTDFEVIIVDDGSPDGCPAICDEYAEKDARVKVIHKKNGGLSSARNAGLVSATGEYVWFIDSDDYLSEEAIKDISEYLSENTDIVTFGYFSKQTDGNTVTVKAVYSGMADKQKIEQLVQTACSQRMFTFVWRSIYRREFLDKNELTFVDGLSHAEDSAFNSKAFLVAENIMFADKNLYVYRHRTDSISKEIGKKFDEKIINHFLVYDKIRDDNFEKYCSLHTDTYYKDAGKFVMSNIYFPSLIRKIYRSGNKNKFSLFKRVSSSEMMRKAFRRYDINEEKSNSMDWWVLWAARHRLYLLGHLICKYILYK